MAAVQMMCARIGMVTGQGLAGNFKQRFPRWLLRAFILALLAANTINIAADLAGMADAAEMLSGVNSRWFVVVFALLISWATVRLRYHQIANVLKWLVLVLVAYPIAAFVVGDDWGRVVRDTLVPSMPHTREEWSMLVAILGTTISPYLFFWQASEEVEEEKAAGLNSLSQRRGATAIELQLRKMDVGVGTFFSNVVMFFIILTTAITLNRHGITHIETTRQAAEALRPLAGKFAATLFIVGIVGVGFLAIPTLAGSAAYAFAETLGWRQALDKKLKQARAFYILILLSTGVGVGLDFVGINPVKALYWTAVINGLLAPFLLVAILVETNIHYPTDSSLLGDGTRVLTRTMKKIEQKAGGLKRKVRDRMRSVRKRVLAIALSTRYLGAEGEARRKKQYRELLSLTRKTVNQAQGILEEVKTGPRARRIALRSLVESLATMMGRVSIWCELECYNLEMIVL